MDGDVLVRRLRQEHPEALAEQLASLTVDR